MTSTALGFSFAAFLVSIDWPSGESIPTSTNECAETLDEMNTPEWEAAVLTLPSSNLDARIREDVIYASLVLSGDLETDSRFVGEAIRVVGGIGPHWYSLWHIPRVPSS